MSQSPIFPPAAAKLAGQRDRQIAEAAWRAGVEAAVKVVRRRADKLNGECEYASVEWDTNAVNCSYRGDCICFNRTEDADEIEAAIRALQPPPGLGDAP